jgi:hypothetical protein
MQDSHECICLHCGLTHCLAAAELILERQPHCDYPIATNRFCDQCSGALGVLDAKVGPGPEEDGEHW